MDLYQFHRVLIASAILFFGGFAVYSYQQYTSLGTTSYFSMAVVSGIISLLAIGYLVSFNAKLRKLHDKARSPSHR